MCVCVCVCERETETETEFSIKPTNWEKESNRENLRFPIRIATSEFKFYFAKTKSIHRHASLPLAIYKLHF